MENYTENYALRLDTVQNLVRLFETFCPKIYIRKYLKQFSTQRSDIA